MFQLSSQVIFFDSEFALGGLLIGYIKCKNIAPSNLFKISK